MHVETTNKLYSARSDRCTHWSWVHRPWPGLQRCPLHAWFHATLWSSHSLHNNTLSPEFSRWCHQPAAKTSAARTNTLASHVSAPHHSCAVRHEQVPVVSSTLAKATVGLVLHLSIWATPVQHMAHECTGVVLNNGCESLTALLYSYKRSCMHPTDVSSRACCRTMESHPNSACTDTIVVHLGLKQGHFYGEQNGCTLKQQRPVESA